MGNATTRRRRRTPGGLMHSVTLAGLLVCGLVAARIALVIINAEAQTHAVRAGERIAQVLDVSQLAEREAVDLETGLRGYAATGDRRFLAPWSVAYRDLPAEMGRLQLLVSKQHDQARVAAELARQVQAYATGYTLPFVDRASPLRGRPLLRYLERGKALLDAVRDRFDAFDAEQHRAQLVSDARAAAADGRFEATTVAAGGLLLVAVLGLVAMLFWRVVRPVRQVIEACAEVARGNRRVRLAEVGSNELAQLKRAFNAMVDQLEDREAELKAGAGELEEALELTEAVLETAHDAFVSIDDQGRITAWNPSAGRIFGHSKEQAIGRSLAELIIPRRLREAHRDGIARFLAMGEQQVLGRRLELPALRADGTEFPSETTIAMASRGGRPTFHAFIADISARRAAEFETRLLASVVDGSQDAIISKDANGVVTSWNRGAERLYGYTAPEMIGQAIAVLVPPERAGEDQRLLATALRSHAVQQLDTVRVGKDGRRVEVSLTVSPIWSDGRVVGASSIAREIGGRLAAERALRERERQLAEAQALARVGSWEWRVGASQVSLSQELCRILGRDAGYGPSYEEFGGVVHPEDRQSPEADIEEVQDGQVKHTSYRIIRPDGDVRHVNGRRYARLDAQGRVTHVFGTAQDVTEQWRAEEERRQAQEREVHTSRRLQSILGNLVGSGITLYDSELRLVFADGPLFEGEGIEEWIGLPLAEYMGEESMAMLGPCLADALAGQTATAVLEQPRMGIPLAAHMAPYREADGTISGVLVQWQDISSLRSAQTEAQAAQEHFRHAFDAAPIGMALLSPRGTIERVNEALRGSVDRTSSDLEGERLATFMHPSDRERGLDALERSCRAEAEAVTTELRLIRVAGPPVDVSLHATALRDPDGAVTHILCQLQDVTERKRYESQLQFMADHDPLTGLLNRRKFEAELDRHVAQVKRYGPEGALIALDVDHFKQVNDTLGHNAGDQLIVSIAGVLRGVLRESDILARLGGDEFAVLLPKATADEARRVAHKIVKAVRTKTTLLDGEAKRVTTSVGVAMFAVHDREELTGESILVEADLAMYDAKEAGRDGCAFYSTSEHDVSRTKARLTWVARIERALADNRFVLAAQPILDLHTGQIRQHELLIRMLDDRDELVPPATFLNIAERSGLMGRIDEWVVTRAIELLEHRPVWQQLEVNISGRSLGDQRLLAAIEQRLALSTIDPSRLILEVTETAAVANITQAQAFAQRLRDLGCRFALDDFGAGFGSFYYLKHLPFDYVKIDGEFVQHVASGHVDRLVIEAVVRIAGGLGKETIAEFVTDEKTQRMVTRLGVDYAQGYYIGKPTPVEPLPADEPAPRKL